MGGNVENEERGRQRERGEIDRQLEKQQREIGIDWGQTWQLIEETDQ